MAGDGEQTRPRLRALTLPDFPVLTPDINLRILALQPILGTQTRPMTSHPLTSSLPPRGPFFLPGLESLSRQRQWRSGWAAQ